jgi:hypothetical protein
MLRLFFFNFIVWTGNCFRIRTWSGKIFRDRLCFSVTWWKSQINKWCWWSEKNIGNRGGGCQTCLIDVIYIWSLLLVCPTVHRDSFWNFLCWPSKFILKFTLLIHIFFTKYFLWFFNLQNNLEFYNLSV